MNAKRQCAMVKSVAKNMKAKEKAEANKEKVKDKLYKILNNAGKTLDDIVRQDMKTKDYDFVVKYVTDNGRYPLSMYPNLL